MLPHTHIPMSKSMTAYCCTLKDKRDHASTDFHLFQGITSCRSVTFIILLFTLILLLYMTASARSCTEKVGFDYTHKRWIHDPGALLTTTLLKLICILDAILFLF